MVTCHPRQIPTISSSKLAELTPAGNALCTSAGIFSPLFTTEKIVMKLMPASEAAAHLMISPSTLAHYRCSGKGPEFIKIGRRVFYDEESIEQWLHEHTFKSTSEATETKR